MSFMTEIERYAPGLASIRQKIHRHPELGFEETRTSRLVADELKSCGIEVVESIGKTGVVGILRNGSSERSIAIRADMDALPIHEETGLSYSSKHANKMHACGHDGHTTMLLGAAKYLAATKRFDGIIHFIFQPAEEGLGGAKAMIEDGLFARFPVSSIYAMHNMPGIPAGNVAVRAGPIMAGADNVDITVIGKGGHAALPHRTIDPIPIQAQLISSLQQVVARNIDPIENAVISITQVVGGSAYNVIPDEVSMRGSIRYFEKNVAQQLRNSIDRIVANTCKASGATYRCEFTNVFEPTVNDEKHVGAIVSAAEQVVGVENVSGDAPALMGSEDFGFMLQEVPGCYLLIGNGDAQDDCTIHNPGYDFNDDILVTGSSLWASLVEQELASNNG